MDILDLLASDVKIVDATLRYQGDGNTSLGFPESLMPDKRAFTATFDGQLSPAILRDWCNRVRGEWDARQRRKEAEEASRATVHGTGGVGENRPADAPAGADGSTGGDGEEGEAGLESSLQSEVARWARREREAAEEVSALEMQLHAAGERKRTATLNLIKAEKVLAFYLSQEKGDEL